MAHIRYFNKITSTMKFPNVPSTSSKFSITSKAIVFKSEYEVSSTPAVSSDVVELKDMVRALILDKKNQTPAPAPVKAIEQIDIELTKTPVNENCSAVILKKFPEKLGDPGKFLIPYDFPEMNECLALADLDASINLMPLSIWKELNLPALTKTRMILELADRTISTPTGIAEDVFVKVGTFFFPADFVVVDYVAHPRVPLILGRPFLRTACALIDVHGEQMTLRHDDQSVTFKVGDTKTFSYNIIESVNRVDVIDIVCEEYVSEVLEISESGNPTSPSDLKIDSRSPSFTPFGGSDFLMEEIDAFLKHDDSIPPGVDGIYDSEGDTVYLEELLNPPYLELKDLPSHLEYAFLEGDDKLPVIIAKNLKDEDKTALIKVLKSHKHAIAWKISDIKGIDPQFCTHKILMEENAKPVVQHQRRVNPKIYEVIKQEVIKLLDAGLIYPISDSPWVSPVHCVPKKGGITVVKNEENELIPTRLVTGWRVCIDYRKLNDATRKDHFPLPFMDQMLERLARNEYYCFLAFKSRLTHLIKKRLPSPALTGHLPIVACLLGYAMHRARSKDKMLQRCEDTNLVLNWEKCHFMVKEGIVLGHKISKSGIEVDKSKVDVIAKLPHPTTVKGIRSFLGHAGFYRRFIQDFSKIARPMTHLLEKETPFIFSKECIEAFETLKMKLTQAPILVAPDWDLPFEIMCDASDFAVGAVLGQRKTKHFQPIHYASKTMTEAQAHYTTTEKELLAVVYAFEKFWPYLVLSKSIVYTDHSALKYLLAKQDAKPRLLRWILLLQEFDVVIRDKKGAENLAADHLSRLENPHQSELEKKEITETFPLETLGMVTFRGDDNAPWFADFANYHAGNFVIKGMSSQQKRKQNLARDEMHKNSIKFAKYLIPCGGIDLYGAIPSSRGEQIYSRSVDYLSKWVERKRSSPPPMPSRSVKNHQEAASECNYKRYVLQQLSSPKLISVWCGAVSSVCPWSEGGRDSVREAAASGIRGVGGVSGFSLVLVGVGSVLSSVGVGFAAVVWGRWPGLIPSGGHCSFIARWNGAGHPTVPPPSVSPENDRPTADLHTIAHLFERTSRGLRAPSRAREIKRVCFEDVARRAVGFSKGDAVWVGGFLRFGILGADLGFEDYWRDGWAGWAVYGLDRDSDYHLRYLLSACLREDGALDEDRVGVVGGTVWGGGLGDGWCRGLYQRLTAGAVLWGQMGAKTLSLGRDSLGTWETRKD
ncbi:reverse transcriptase domain-containing protein [Tanacetum coccineum]